MISNRLSELVAETRHAAANPEHPWDKRALEWPLTRESTVIDVGGYKGRWALQIAERHHPRLYVFEPQPWAADVCREVLGDRAVIIPNALGMSDGTFSMARFETDGCTFVNGNGPLGAMHEISAAFAEYGITHIDLMMMNIEGYEYTLIPHMLDKGIHPQRLMVQFHTFADPDGTKLADIHDRLAGLGYTIPWSYGTQLTAWERVEQPAPRKRGRKPKATIEEVR